MVKITLEYPNVDAAIVALGKLTSAAGTTIVEGKPRKGRSDKGVPRKQDAQPPAPEAAAAPSPQATAQTAPADADKAEPSGVAPSAVSTAPAAASSVASEADAQKALEKLFESFPDSATGIAEAKKILTGFGVSRVRDLKEDQRADFIAKATAALPKTA